VFTAGIGENSTVLRRRICERLAVLGVPSPNEGRAGDDEVLAAGGEDPAVLRVRAREDVVIAEAAAALAVREG
jgi:acetate kinase